jgi:hypothetical protein
MNICKLCGDKKYLELIVRDKDLRKFIGIGVCPDCNDKREENK